MEDFIIHLFLCSFWIFGVRTLFSHDNLLYPVYEWAEKNINEYVLKPTISCVMCMASLHGATWFFLFLYPLFDWYIVFLFMVCLCGLNSVIDSAIN